MSTGIAAIVVQFGLAMIPLRASAMASGLTSLTTSGTSGSIRQADELSTTVTPASANRGASARDVVAPAEKSAMSSPLGSAVLGVLDGDLAVAVRQQRAGGPGGGEEADLVGGEVALEQDLSHGDAHLTGGADDAETDSHRYLPVPP